MTAGAGDLTRRLTLLHVFCIATGAMISSGLFVLPGLAYSRAGPAMIPAYLLAGLLSVPGMLSLAEMTTAMPRAGADCFVVIRSFGPGIGTVSGLLSWFSLSMKAAFALLGVSVFLAPLLGANMHVIALVFGACFLGVNLTGVREAGWTQVVLAAALFGLMVVFVVRGLPAVSAQRFEPFAPHGLPAVFFVTGYVFISYGGLLKIASVAEEVRAPSRNIPLGMVLSLLAVTVAYALMAFVTVGVMEPEQLDGSLTPISDAATVFMGSAGGVALGVAAILAFMTTANAGIMTAARSLVPLSRDGLFPAAFARIGARHGTPGNALLLTGGLIAAALFLRLEVLVEAASVVLILTNVLVCLSLIVLRESGLQNYRPRFRAPLYPWLQVAGLLGYGFVLLEMGVEAYLIAALLALVGFCTYWFYGRRRVRGESALLHLVERIVAGDFVTGSLEAELRQIIHQRDEVVQDRFDAVVERADALDLDGPTELDEFLGLAAGRLAERTGLPAEGLIESLRQRESQGSTAITAGVAVPHVVADGEHIFELLLARCRGGITFASDRDPVHAAFVIVASADERSFYLSALAAIAQIIGHPQFAVRWRKARGASGLRDVLLLGERPRS